jgi:hypothetical protein
MRAEPVASAVPTLTLWSCVVSLGGNVMKGGHQCRSFTLK